MRIHTLHFPARRIIQPPKLRVQFSSMAESAQPNFAQGEDEGRLMTETAALLESKWALDETHQGLQKTFNFPSYAKALVSHAIPHRVVAEIHIGLHTPYRGGNQIAKPPS